MRSASGVMLLLCLAAPVLALAAEAGDDQHLPVAQGKQPTTRQIDAALAEVRRDPNLPQQRTISSLHWKGNDDKPRDDEIPGWMRWVRGLFTWLGSSARLVSWVLIATLGAL